MKTQLAIMIALASTGAYAQLPGGVAMPGPTGSTSKPNLYPSEQGAFKALEVITQIVESKIVQNGGCKKASYPVEVNTLYDGSGTATIKTSSASVGDIKLAIALGGVKNNLGRWYSINQVQAIDPVTNLPIPQFLNGTAISGVSADGSFNIGSYVQEVSTRLQAGTDVTRAFDNFTGTVIKDYVRLNDLQAIPEGFSDAGVPVEVVIDYGYQQVSKNEYVRAKWWQQSMTWREDGVNAGTWWHKTRVFPKGCTIDVKLAGYGVDPADSIEGFNEKGTLTISPNNGGTPIDVGPFRKGN